MDKAQILMKDAGMRKDVGYESKAAGEKAMKALELLPNNLAHAQDIITFDWPSIVVLAERVEKIMTRL